MPNEEPLAGGNTTAGVIRIGDTVRRPRNHRSAYAASVLLVLQELGFAWAPAFLGIDAEGRDVFSFVPGTTTDHPSQRNEECYAAVGAILATLHRLTRDLPQSRGGSCVVHGDAAPFNTVMQDGMPAALIDWDGAHPGDPLEDVGYAGWTWCVQAEGHVPVAEQADHLRRFRDGYDPSLDADVLLAAVERQQRAVVEVETAVSTGPLTSRARRVHARRAVAWAEADAALLARHRSEFLRALRIR